MVYFISCSPLTMELGIPVTSTSLGRNVKRLRTNTPKAFVWGRTDVGGQIKSPPTDPTRPIGFVVVHPTGRVQIISVNISSGSASALKVSSPTNPQCHFMAKSGDRPLPLFSGSRVSTILADLKFVTYGAIPQLPFSSIRSSSATVLILWVMGNQVNSPPKSRYMTARM